MEDRVDLEDEDYHYYGTPIGDEEETHASQYRKKVKDAASTRALPVWKQEVTDEQGRRRFHGAFTGGFSAGYYNTVGSAEGWAPSTFKSSREQRASLNQQSVEQFLDEDELEDLRRTNLQTTANYDTFGSTAAELARRAAVEEGRQRPAPIPGLLPDEVLAPVAESIGVKLLQRMGWRQGKGVGAGVEGEEEDSQDAMHDSDRAKESKKRRRWSRHATTAAEDTPLYQLAPKNDAHGLGFDPFQGAEEFREARHRRLDAHRPSSTHQEHQQKHKGALSGTSGATNKRRGIAFGSGVLDEDDCYGIMEDYVTHDDTEVERYTHENEDDEDDKGADARGFPRSRVPRVEKRGLGDRLALKGYSYEIMDVDEGDDEDDDDRRPNKRQKEQKLLTTGTLAPLLLQNQEQINKGGLIPGFIKAESIHEGTFFPPPKIPQSYVPRCPLLPLQTSRNEPYQPQHELKKEFVAPPQVGPPDDSELRQEIDRLAFYVARNGEIFENVARDRQRSEGTRNFLLENGNGSGYYKWKLYSLRKLIQQPSSGDRGGGRKKVERKIGQRSIPLTVDERGAILGEIPLQATLHSDTTATVAGASAANITANQQQQHPQAPREQQQSLARSLLNVTEADRQRIQHMLGSTFVKASTQDMLHPDQSNSQLQSGLRPGFVPPPPSSEGPPSTVGKQLSSEQKGDGEGRKQVDATSSQRVITAADLSRPLQEAVAASGLPIRRVEEWRPAALLCKRLNVPDPYKGKSTEVQMSRFRTDYLALPDTAAAIAGAAAGISAPGSQDFLLPDSVKAAIDAAKEKAQGLALTATTFNNNNRAPAVGAAASQGVQQQQQQQPEEEDAAGMADAFLNSISGVFDEEVWAPPGVEALADHQLDGGGGGAGHSVGETPLEVAPGKPIDLFKAILEDSDSDSDEEDTSEDDAQQQHKQNQQQEQEQNQEQQQVAGAAAVVVDTHKGHSEGVGFDKLKSDVSRLKSTFIHEKNESGGAGSGPFLLGTEAPGSTKAGLAGGGGGKAKDAIAATAPVDESMQKRVEQALKLLKKSGKKEKKDKKKKKSSKDKKRKDKDIDRKHKKKERDRSHKHSQQKKHDKSSDENSDDSSTSDSR